MTIAWGERWRTRGGFYLLDLFPPGPAGVRGGKPDGAHLGLPWKSGGV